MTISSYSVLHINDRAQAAARKIAAYAEAHHYIPGPGAVIPGDDPVNHVLAVGGNRVVFSMTESDGVLYRHLSVSRRKGYPSPIAMWAIASMFGFTGWNRERPDDPGPTWRFTIAKEQRCIIVLEPVATLPGVVTN